MQIAKTPSYKWLNTWLADKQRKGWVNAYMAEQALQFAAWFIWLGSDEPLPQMRLTERGRLEFREGPERDAPLTVILDDHILYEQSKGVMSRFRSQSDWWLYAA